MAPQDDSIDVRDLRVSGGDDSPPLMNCVVDPPPAAYGGVTSVARTLSPQYIAFLSRHHKEVSDGNRQ